MANKHKSQAGLSLFSTVLESFLHRHNTTIIDYESRPQFIKEELCGALLSKSIVTSSVLLLNTVKWFRKIFELNILGGVNLCVPDIFATSVQFSYSVMSDSLWLHEPLHARPPCPSPTPGAYPNPCPLSWWCHPAISSSVIPFSSCSQSLPASGSFQMSQLFTSGGQSIGVSASISVLPMNTQDWSPLGWNGWISLQSKGLSSLLQHHSSKVSISGAQLSL